MAWLMADLTAHETPCTLAYFHRAVFTSGTNGDDAQMRGVWQVLYHTGVDVVLAGHDHDYERFAPMDDQGVFDPDRGVREFVVGTGGAQMAGTAITGELGMTDRMGFYPEGALLATAIAGESFHEGNRIFGA